jgi:acid phosphatase (class A)
MAKAATTAAQQFSESGWGHWQWLLKEIAKSGRPKAVTYRGVLLELKPPPTNPQTEKMAMLGLAALRGPLETAIVLQARCTNAAVAAVLASIGVSSDNWSEEMPVNLKLKQLREDIIREVKPPVDEFKRNFRRPRPWIEFGAELQPLLMPPHWLYPGQPAYPAGHATVAWVVADLFGEYGTPAQKAKLKAAATQVALNRVIAGVHYPSDSEAGKKLAAQLVKVMRAKNPKLVARVAAFMKTVPTR